MVFVFVFVLVSFLWLEKNWRRVLRHIRVHPVPGYKVGKSKDEQLCDFFPLI